MRAREGLLEVRDLSTVLEVGDQTIRAVDGVSFDLDTGETLALLGESGCGKSMTALSLMRLLPDAGRVSSGSVRLQGVDLLGLPEAAMREVRGARMAMIFQEPGSSLNPVTTVEDQIAEVLRRHTLLQGAAVKGRVLELLHAVGIPDPARRAGEYAFQLSGGMKQRVMIAGALGCGPRLLIADEPTTALDVTIQAQVLELLAQIQRDTGMAMLLITHDLAVVAEVAQRVAVMYAGQIVEVATREAFFKDAAHPYSRKLFEALPAAAQRGRRLAVIPGLVPSLAGRFTGCRFVDRCDFAGAICRSELPQMVEISPGHSVRCHLHAQAKAMATLAEHLPGLAEPARAAPLTPLLEVRDLRVYFPVRRGVLRQIVGHVKAVDGVSLQVPRGRTLALVGESGCGKTTVGKGILRLVPVTQGQVRLGGQDLATLTPSALRAQRRHLQIIFQDPFGSLSPRMRVAEIVEEGILALQPEIGAQERAVRVDELLRQVGLSAEMKMRYPHEFSGGQRQRIAIARALAVEPRLIVCDEPTSALDVSVQAQILNLLGDLQQRLGLTYLFITHNIAVVEFLAHEVAVMYLGRIVETGTTEEVLGNPCHPYTQALLSAAPAIDRAGRGPVIRLQGEMPSPVNPPRGCHFHPRCPKAMPVCAQSYPSTTAVSATHEVACFLYSDAASAAG